MSVSTPIGDGTPKNNKSAPPTNNVVSINQTKETNFDKGDNGATSEEGRVSSHNFFDVAIIGNGPVGVYFCNKLIEKQFKGRIIIFGDEPYSPYNRVALSQLLSGEKKLEQLSTHIHESENLVCKWHTRVTEIDTNSKSITDNHDEIYSFDKLVLATGSRAHLPEIDGINSTGVYVFRNLKDTTALLSRKVGSRHTVVLGGGLLGIETAKAMRKLSTQVTLIHHSPWLMNRQLDQKTANKLAEKLQHLGIKVLTNTSIQKVLTKNEKVSSILCRDGKEINCDTLIVSTGIQPNIEIARSAGITVGRGIKINETLHTNHQDVYAIGECTEVDGEVFGLVTPGLEQASILANNIHNSQSERYQHKSIATKLKVLDFPVTSIGRIGQIQDTRESRYLTHTKDSNIRVLHIQGRHLVGAAALGEWKDQEKLKELIDNHKNLSLYQTLKFRLTGNIWPENSAIEDKHIICNCQQVSAGEIRSCLRNNMPVTSTGASTVCGSCVPFIELLREEIDENPQNHTAIKNSYLLSFVGIIAVILIALFQFSNAWTIPTNYSPDHFSKWWTDNDYRQITGFTCLGLVGISLLLSLRKRSHLADFLSFENWRWIHIGLTTAILAILYLHTGLSEFQGINLWLIYCFWGTAILGVITTFLTDYEKTGISLSIRRYKNLAILGHIIAFWPLPILLIFHILSVYWF